MKNFTSIGLGTWMMETSKSESVRALQSGLDEGANHIDTAEMYGEGEVEELVGEAIIGRRDQLYLVSKVLPRHAAYADVIKACEKSLQRLRTDYLDIYLLHWRERATPLAETFRAFEKLKSDGKIQAWGVSNFDVEDMEEAVRLVGEPSQEKGRLVCNQVYYSIQERAVEEKLLPWCQAHASTLVAYSPLGQGRILHHPLLKEIARSSGGTPAQVALAFLISRGAISIPKSSSISRAKENVGAMKLKISKEDGVRLNEVFPVRTRRTLPMI